MTEQSKQLLTHICRDRLWERDYTQVDEEMAIAAMYDGLDDQGNFYTIGKEFDSDEAAQEYMDAIRELHEVRVKWSVSFGDCVLEFDGGLLGGIWRYGRHLLIKVARAEAQELMGQHLYIWQTPSGIKNGDFIDWISRNNGTHWDALKRTEGDEDDNTREVKAD